MATPNIRDGVPGPKPKSAFDRIRGKIERRPGPMPTECWCYVGTTDRKGYGIVSVGSTLDGSNSTSGAHRISWEHARGSIPDGLWVLHKCDVPSCCNPDHLFLGTSQDNVDDCKAKGRIRTPDRDGMRKLVAMAKEKLRKHPELGKHKHPKLSDAEVLAIRSSQESQRQMADRYGVHPATISKILSGNRRRYG